jgi:hypothetical protein
MATQQITYGTPNTVINTNGLAGSGAAYQSATVTYVTSGATTTLDLLVQGSLSFSTAPSAAGTFTIYVAGSYSSTFPDGLTGTAGTYTLATSTNLIPITTVNVPAVAGGYYSETFAIASLFGGVLPPNLVFVIQNNTNATAATAAVSVVPVTVQIG